MLEALSFIATEGGVNPDPLPVSDMFFSEFLGTAVLLMFGVGTVATNLLLKSKGKDSGWLLITFGWGFAVYMGVFAGWKTGGHINPAVTIAKAVWYLFDPKVTLSANEAGTVAVTFGNVMIFIVAQLVGAFVGAAVAWLAYKKHFDEQMEIPEAKRWCFCTAPEIRSYGWNLVTEAIGTAALIIFIMTSGGTPHQVGPLAVAFCVTVIGMALGGPTGYAINQARDLGPRIAHAVLPMKGGKADNDWAYSWVPVVGPTIGAVVGVLVTIGTGMVP